MNNKLKFIVHTGLFLLLMVVSANCTFAQLANVKPEANLSTELDAEKDWEYLDDFKSFFCDYPEYCEIMESFNLFEYVKYADSIMTIKKTLAESFLENYPQNRHYDEVLDMFFNAHFEPYFISKNIEDTTFQILKIFPNSLLRKPLNSKEVSKFYRALPIDRPAMDSWLKKGRDLVAKVIASEATDERKAELEMRVISRDLRIARNRYLYLGLKKESLEREYWQEFDSQYWELYRKQIESLLFKYPDLPILAKYVTRFIDYVTRDNLSPALREEYWRSFYRLTQEDKPLAERLAFRSLHKVAQKNLKALERFNDFDFSKPLEMQFTAMDGTRVNLANMRGKVILLDFWTYSCPGCIIEMPHVRAMYDKYRDQGFEVIGIAANGDGAKETILEIQKKTGANWPQRLDKGKDATVSYMSLYGIKSYPTVWLLDKEGKVVDKKARGQRLEPLIRKYLGLDKEKNELFAKIKKAEKDQNWKDYTKFSIDFVNTYVQKDYEGLNYFAWNFYENDAITDTKALNEALKWSSTSIENDKEHELAFMDTYASLLYKLGNKKEALKTAKKILKATKKVGADTTTALQLIEKINAN